MALLLVAAVIGGLTSLPGALLGTLFIATIRYAGLSAPLQDFLSAFGVLLLLGPVAKRHFADVADSAMYWFFIVLIWVPLYFMLYVSPRLFRG